MRAKKLAIKLLLKENQHNYEVRVAIGHNPRRGQRSEYRVKNIKVYDDDEVIVIYCSRVTKIVEPFSFHGFIEELDDIISGDSVEGEERRIKSKEEEQVILLKDGAKATITKGKT